MSRRRQEGFTLVELLISLTIASILLAIIYNIFISQRRGHVVQEQVAEAQQNARIGADELTRALKGIGNNIDRNPLPPNTPPQQQLLYCGPYELLFNSNVDDNRPAVVGTAAIASVYGAGTIYTAPGINYLGGQGTGAETYLYALKANGARQFDLVRKVFWNTGTNSDVEERVVASNLSNHDDNGAPRPLFLYWGDFDLDASLDLWGDTNEDGVLDATELANLTPIAMVGPLAGRRFDDVVRRIEIAVTGETAAPDRAYAKNAGYRQVEIRSAITPRNLWACPIITPLEWTTTIQAPNVAGQPPLPYTFNVTYLNAPENGRTVNFTLTPPPGVAAGIAQLTTPTVTTVGGVATARIQWPNCATLAGLLATHGNILRYTLAATLGEPPSLNTPLGTCPADSASMTIEIIPGPPAWVVRVSPARNPNPCTATEVTIPTCGGATDAIYQVQDGCGTPVDLPAGQSIQFLSADRPLGRALGTLTPLTNPTGPLVGTVDGFPYAVKVRYNSPQVWPSPSPTRVNNSFPVDVWAQSVGLQSRSAPCDLTILLEPRPFQLLDPLTLVPPPALPAYLNPIDNIRSPINLNTAPTRTHEDCPSADKLDAIAVADCFGNLVFDYDTALYSITPTIGPAGNGPTGAGKQGTLSNAVTALGNGLYQFTYTPPTCTLGPGKDIRPNYILTLSRLTLSPPNIGTGAQIQVTRPFPLKSCSDCALSADPATMSRCSGSTIITVTGCSAGMIGKDVTFTVSRVTAAGPGGGNGSFLPSPGTSATKQVTLVAGAAGQVTASATLYVGAAQHGDVLRVVANSVDVDLNNQPLWSCGPVDIPVTSQCQDLRIYTIRNGTEVTVGDQGSEENCLGRINELYFEVTDCQFHAARLTNAIKVYAISDEGRYVDWEYADLDPYPATQYPPLVFRTLDVSKAVILESSATPPAGGTQLYDRRLYYKPGRSIQIVATYADPNDLGDNHYLSYTAPVTSPVLPTADRCQKVVTLAAPLPICFPNAITSGGGGSWNGNFKVHWGDVVIRGDVELASQPKFIEKTSNAVLDSSRYSGATNSDRFLDLYVGKKADGSGGRFVDNSGIPVPDTVNPGQIDQPFRTNGEGAAIGDIYGNYFRNISYPKITEMLQELDYDQLKTLAWDRGVYWYTVAGQTIHNPKTGVTATLQDVLDIPSGTRNANYDGKFIFVDTFGSGAGPTAFTGAQIDLMPTASLPQFTLGQLYTQGIIYICGSVDYQSGGGGRTVTGSTPPEYESRYDHNDPTVAFTESMLPVRPNITLQQHTVNLADININGGVYVDGIITFSGSPSIFGAVTAERGYAGNGTPELWYNYQLNTSSNLSVCVTCCSLTVTPSAALVLTGATRNLTANGPVVTWQSLDDTIATVTATGTTTATVTALRPGIVRIKAMDRNNCSTWVTITVADPCTSFSIVPATVNAVVGQMVTLNSQGYAPGNQSFWWTYDSTLANLIGPQDTPDLTLWAKNSGGPSTITLTGGGCATPADATLTVQCPATAVQIANPIPRGGTTTAVLSPMPAGVTVRWRATDVAPANNVVSVNPNTGTVIGVSLGEANIWADLFVDGVQSNCSYHTSPPLLVTNVVACNLQVAPAASTVRKCNPCGQVGLTASGNVGTVTWTKDSDDVILSATTGLSTLATANTTSNNRTVHITATDNSVPNCRVTVTVTTSSN